MILRLSTKETRKLHEKGEIVVKRDGLKYDVTLKNGELSYHFRDPYDGVKMADLTKKYKIHCKYEDTIHARNNNDENQDFFVEQNKLNHFEPIADYEEARELFDNIVTQNEKAIEMKKLNTFYLLELIEVDKYGRETILEKHEY